VYNRNVARYRGQKIKRFAALFVGLAAFLPVAEGSARARDLPRSDPDRLAILNAARGKDDAKFIVKDLFKSGDFAFLCALKQDPKYGIARTDEMLDVYLFVFIKHESAWIAVNAGDGFAKDARHVPCTVAPRGDGKEVTAITSQEDVARVMVAVARDRILQNLDFRKFDDADVALLRVLLQRQLVSDVNIEKEKEKLDRVQLELSKDRCATPACVNENRKAFEMLGGLQNDAKISSLVWNGCRYGLRVGNLAVIRECVSEMSPRPYCRPNMNLLGDRKDIDKCIDEIDQLCRRTIGEQWCR